MRRIPPGLAAAFAAGAWVGAGAAGFSAGALVGAAVSTGATGLVVGGGGAQAARSMSPAPLTATRRKLRRVNPLPEWLKDWTSFTFFICLATPLESSRQLDSLERPRQAPIAGLL